MEQRGVAGMLRPILTRIRNASARAVIRLVNDNSKVQALQLGVLAGETVDAVERFQEYGFTSHPFAGSEAAVLFLGGDRSHGIVVAVDDRRYRLKAMAQGEVALYDDQGQVVHLKREGVLIESPHEVKLRAPSIVLDGPVTATSTVTAETEVTAAGIALTAHTHGGVEPGGGNTGQPNGGA